MSLKGKKFCNNDLNQNSVSFLHMFNAYQNRVFKFKSCRRKCGDKNSTYFKVLRSEGRKYVGMDKGQTICPLHFAAGV